MVLAGAGAGKTRTLVARVRWLVESGHCPPERIAVATFTRKAASELRRRLGPRARAITVGTIHHLAREVVRRAGRNPLPLSPWQDGAERLARIEEWLTETCAQVPERALDRLQRIEALRRGGASRVPALACADPALARLAWAARTLGLAPQCRTDRVRVHAGSRHAVLALTPAAIPGAIVLAPASVRLWQREGRTAEALTARLALAWGEPVEATPSPTPRVLRTETHALLGELQAAMALRRAHPPRSRPPVPVTVQGEALGRLADALLARYERALAERGERDHDGTIRAGLARCLEPGYVPAWDAVLVDEYQDVNPVQDAFVQALGTRSTWCVGDDWQAIFGFQHTSSALLRTFESQRADAEVHRLEHTFRFGPRLAGAARRLIHLHGAGIDKELIGRPGGDPTDGGAAVRVVSAALPDAAPPGPGATAPVCAVLDAIADQEHAEPATVLVIARNNAQVEDEHEAVKARAERLLRRWIERPHTAPAAALDAGDDATLRDAAWARAGAGVSGLDREQVRAAARHLRVDLEAATVHGAKGAEADHVIYLDPGPASGYEDRAGEVCEEALAELRHHPFEARLEEVRIGYVAVSRARRVCWIVTPGNAQGASLALRAWLESPDAAPGEVDLDPLPGRCAGYARPELCPWCRDGWLQTGPKGKVHCSNAPQCPHTEGCCPACGTGVVRREEEHGRCANAACEARVALCRCPVPRPLRPDERGVLQCRPAHGQRCTAHERGVKGERDERGRD